MDVNLLIADLLKNVAIWLPIAVTLVSSVITAATKYNNSAGIVGTLQRVLGVLSFLENFDAPAQTSALKLPLHPVALPLGGLDHVAVKCVPPIAKFVP